MSIKLHDGWMEVKYKCLNLIGTVSDTDPSFGKVSLIVMAIMTPKTQNKLNRLFKLLYHKVFKKI